MLLLAVGAGLAILAARKGLQHGAAPVPAAVSPAPALAVEMRRESMRAAPAGIPSALPALPANRPAIAARAEQTQDPAGNIIGSAIASGLKGAGVAAAGTVAAGGSVAEGAQAAAASVAPGAAAVVAFDVIGAALALSAAFGGPDIFNALSTGGTTPQLDATTAGGQVLAQRSAALIKQSLVDTGGADKFSLKAGGRVGPASMLGG